MTDHFSTHLIRQNFSPLLIAGLMIRPLPTGPLDRLLGYIVRRIQNNHPAIIERLRPLAGSRFLICPTDLPHDIILTIGEDHLDCRIRTESHTPPETTEADVTISGSFLSLIDMIDGKQDGDGLFFARNLAVEGDTEALLTLRNAIDSDDINLRAEILDLLGPLKGPAQILMRASDHLYCRLAGDMNILSRAIIAPVSDHCDDLEQENHSLRERIDHIERMLAKTRSRLQSLGRKVTP